MKLVKTFISAYVLGSALFNGSVFAAEKAAEPIAMVQTANAETQQTADMGNKLNINTATAGEIQKALTGIGAKKAEAIVQYREKHGNFTTAEQLLEVQGIGKATLEKNRDRLAF